MWVNNNFEVTKAPKWWQNFYDIYVKESGYAGTFDQFKATAYGGVSYYFAQLLEQTEVNVFLINQSARDFYLDANKKILGNNLSFSGTQRIFKERLSLDVSLNLKSNNYEIAIDYIRSNILDDKIAALLIENCYSCGQIMAGDIENAYQRDENSQTIIAKWRQKEDKPVFFRVEIETTGENDQPIYSVEEIRATFLNNFKERYIWGNRIQAQRYLTLSDVSFSSNIIVYSKLALEDEWGTIPIELEFYQKAQAVLTMENIEIVSV